jgi:hypothetical protein
MLMFKIGRPNQILNMQITPNYWPAKMINIHENSNKFTKTKLAICKKTYWSATAVN